MQKENGQRRQDVPCRPHPYDALNKKFIEGGAAIVVSKKGKALY
jgi:hypothetical protein